MASIDLMQFANVVNDAWMAHRPPFLATSNEHGAPDIGPKGSMFVADGDHLAYLEYSKGGHLRNLRANPRVAVVCFNPEADLRYLRFYGEAELLESGELRNELRARVIPVELAHDPEDEGIIIRIRVDEVASPQGTLRRV
ncbi:MAG: pyridoxamine 5'-phosphate oxidase family protein [Mycobacterium sp.]|nr:pyridoxamine 5'-phosphate oxidase family protein [Mycobacterium sp.]